MKNALFLSLLLFVAGCSDNGQTRSKDDIARGQESLAMALDSWVKNDNKPAKEFIFTEEWQKTHSLAEYKIGKANVPDNRSIAYPVVIVVKDKKGKTESRDVTYLVILGSPNRITRDPYN